MMIDDPYNIGRPSVSPHLPTSTGAVSSTPRQALVSIADWHTSAANGRNFKGNGSQEVAALKKTVAPSGTFAQSMCRDSASSPPSYSLISRLKAAAGKHTKAAHRSKHSATSAIWRRKKGRCTSGDIC